MSVSQSDTWSHTCDGEIGMVMPLALRQIVTGWWWCSSTYSQRRFASPSRPVGRCALQDGSAYSSVSRGAHICAHVAFCTPLAQLAGHTPPHISSTAALRRAHSEAAHVVSPRIGCSSSHIPVTELPQLHTPLHSEAASIIVPSMQRKLPPIEPYW